jgi:hypothetical protein
MNSTENTDEGTTENTEPWRIEWSDTQAQLHIEAEATAQKNPPAPGWRKLATIHGTSDETPTPSPNGGWKDTPKNSSATRPPMTTS